MSDNEKFKALEKHRGYRLDHPAFRHVYDVTYVKGVVKKSFGNEDDELEVDVEGYDSDLLPVFYHCGSDCPEDIYKQETILGNNALKYGSAAFFKDDEVIVLVEKEEPKYVVGFWDKEPHECCFEPFIGPELNSKNPWVKYAYPPPNKNPVIRMGKDSDGFPGARFTVNGADYVSPGGGSNHGGILRYVMKTSRECPPGVAYPKYERLKISFEYEILESFYIEGASIDLYWKTYHFRFFDYPQNTRIEEYAMQFKMSPGKTYAVIDVCAQDKMIFSDGSTRPAARIDCIIKYLCVESVKADE
jgi:hypothetical protein